MPLYICTLCDDRCTSIVYDLNEQACFDCIAVSTEEREDIKS
jgi:hypothetical protein